MVEVNFREQIADELLEFAVIIAKSEGKWVFCKHKERNTLEAPGGRREPGEDILETAKRELREETGAIDFNIKPVCAYSVKGKTRFNERDEDENFGMLFVADIFSFEAELHSEMESIVITDGLPEHWTYPEIQPKLLEEVKRRGYFEDKRVESMDKDERMGVEDAKDEGLTEEKSLSETDVKKEPEKNYIGSWLPVGMMLGVAFGSLTDNIGVGISMGMLWGVGLGGIMNSLNRKKSEKSAAKSEQPQGADEEEKREEI